MLLNPACSTGLTLRQLGDALLTAINTLKNMQLLTAIEEFASDLAKRRGGILGTQMIDLTARSNVLVFLLESAFKVIGVDSGAVTESGFGRDLTDDEKEVLFHRSLRARFQRHTERLLNPFEELTEFFLNQSRVASEYRDLFGSEFDPDRIFPPLDVERTRTALYG
jgi:hypothetical protein